MHCCRCVVFFVFVPCSAFPPPAVLRGDCFACTKSEVQIPGVGAQLNRRPLGVSNSDDGARKCYGVGGDRPRPSNGRPKKHPSFSPEESRPVPAGIVLGIPAETGVAWCNFYRPCWGGCFRGVVLCLCLVVVARKIYLFFFCVCKMC